MSVEVVPQMTKMWGKISLVELLKHKYRQGGLRKIMYSSPKWGYCEVKGAIDGQCIVEKNGVKLNLGSEAFSPSMRFQFIYGTFEAHIPDLSEYVLDYAGKSDVDIVELGAGSGFTTCYLNRYLDSSQQYVAVEANKQMVKELSNTRKLNESDFEILHKAYATSSDTVELYLKDDFWASGIHPSLESENSITVPAVDLAHISKKYEIDNFVLFSNMEGTEFELLEAELELLSQRCPLAIIAFHEFAGDVDEYDTRVRGAGFALRDTIGDFHVYENQSISV